MLRIKKKLLATALAAGALFLSGAASAQEGQTPRVTAFGLRLHPDYFNRFGMTTVLASNVAGSSGFGVRYLPLPIDPDIRVSLVKRPNYWEYAIYTRQNDTTFQAGVFDNGDTAPQGIPKLEITHDPFKGLQYAGMIQDQAHVSRFSVGYANPLFNNRARLQNHVGVAFQNEVVAPYTFSQIDGGYGTAVNKYFSVGFGAVARLYTYPLQKQYQASIDIAPNLEIRPTEDLRLNASHLERFAHGTSAIPDFNLARYQETNVAASYRFHYQSDFSVNMLRTRVTRNWTDKRTYLYNDVLFRVNALPVLVGPTVGYQWWPTQADTHWIFGFSTAPK